VQTVLKNIPLRVVETSSFHHRLDLSTNLDLLQIFLGPPERARAETGGADQWVLKRRECSGFARVNQVTSASLRCPLSVFNENSTLKPVNFDLLQRA